MDRTGQRRFDYDPTFIVRGLSNLHLVFASFFFFFFFL